MRPLVACFAVTLAVAGCAIRSDLMTRAGGDVSVEHAAEGRALVVFLRPSGAAGAVQAVIYDGDRFLGASSVHTAIAYQAEPGEHLFMVVSEAADFLGATLVAGKTYYVRVEPRIGAWRARFSLLPVDARRHHDALTHWLGEASVVTVNDRGLDWARENQASVLEKRAEYLPRWRAKPEDERPVLWPGDGL
jgi:hypothetical protein